MTLPRHLKFYQLNGYMNIYLALIDKTVQIILSKIMLALLGADLQVPSI